MAAVVPAAQPERGGESGSGDSGTQMDVSVRVTKEEKIQGRSDAICFRKTAVLFSQERDLSVYRSQPQNTRGFLLGGGKKPHILEKRSEQPPTYLPRHRQAFFQPPPPSVWEKSWKMHGNNRGNWKLFSTLVYCMV